MEAEGRRVIAPGERRDGTGWPRILLAAGVSGGLMLGGQACSSSASSSSASSSATSLSARQKSESLENASVLHHQPPDPCTLLGKKDIDALVGPVISKDSVRPEATIGSPGRNCIWYGKSGVRVTITVLTDASLNEYMEHSKIPVTLQTWFTAAHANKRLDLGIPEVKMAKGLVSPTSRHVFLLYDTLLIDAEISTTNTQSATGLPDIAAIARLIATRADTRWPTLVAP